MAASRSLHETSNPDVVCAERTHSISVFQTTSVKLPKPEGDAQPHFCHLLMNYLKLSDPDSYEPLAQVSNWTNEGGENRQQIHYFHCDQIGIPREIRLRQNGE